MRLARQDTLLCRHARKYQSGYGFTGFVSAAVGATNFIIYRTHVEYDYGMPFLVEPLMTVSSLFFLICFVMRYVMTFDASNVQDAGRGQRRDSVPSRLEMAEWQAGRLRNSNLRSLGHELMYEIEAAARCMRKSPPSDEELDAMSERYYAMDRLAKADSELSTKQRAMTTTNIDAVEKIATHLRVHREIS